MRSDRGTTVNFREPTIPISKRSAASWERSPRNDRAYRTSLVYLVTQPMTSETTSSNCSWRKSEAIHRTSATGTISVRGRAARPAGRRASKRSKGKRTRRHSLPAITPESWGAIVSMVIQLRKIFVGPSERDGVREQEKIQYFERSEFTNCKSEKIKLPTNYFVTMSLRRTVSSILD